jgi:hypothetical protein
MWMKFIKTEMSVAANNNTSYCAPLDWIYLRQMIFSQSQSQRYITIGGQSLLVSGTHQRTATNFSPSFLYYF